jgi:pimeloyl-ACP methyl ester carboxylesterase
MTASAAFARQEKSTTVRTPNKPPFGLRAFRGGLGVLSRFVPEGAALVAEHVFLTPRRRARPDAERDLLREAHAVTLPTPHGYLAAWEWGTEGPRVLLVHGWEGRGAQLGEIGTKLLRMGFRVVTFDAPGHGDSPGIQSSLFHFADAIESAVALLGPFHAIVTHSMGGAAMLWANRPVPLAERLVMIAPPIDLRDFTRTLSRILGLPEDVRGRVHRRIGERFGVALEDVQGPRIASTMHGPLLVVHDEEDRDVPIACGEAVANAWPGAELVRTRGLGHHRILRDEATKDLIVRFVAQGAASSDAPWEKV